MRLTCPNCGAQYEVPDQVVPLDGRDVQCSNCGSTWFQTHPDPPGHEPEDVAEPEWIEEEATEPEPEPEPEPTPRDPYEHDDSDGYETPEPEPELEPTRPLRDSSVTDVLREEAEREARLRAEEEAVGLESQPDLGLDQHMDEAQVHAEEARARIARLRHGEPEDAARPAFDSDPMPEDRSSALPDIEQINSSLKSPERPVSAAPAQSASGKARRKSGFSRGFALSLLIAVILALVYLNAPQIAAAVPQVDPLLNQFVATIDNARLWLDRQLIALTPGAQ